MDNSEINNTINDRYHRRWPAYEIIIAHTNKATARALEMASRSPGRINLDFLRQAAPTQEMGLFLLNAPHIGFNGREKFSRFGLSGWEFMNEESFPEDILVYEKHVGVGLKKEDILNNNISVKDIAMLPVALEQRETTLSDIFLVKDSRLTPRDKNILAIREAYLKRHTQNSDKFHQMYRDLLNHHYQKEKQSL